MSTVLFKEIQNPPVWVWIALTLVVALPLGVVLAGGSSFWVLLIPVCIVGFIVLLFMPMRTAVDNVKIQVSFGPARIIRFTIPIHEINSAQIVTYTPMRTYMGWGIRTGRDRSVCYTMHGSQGVMLEMADGRKKLIGSQRAAELGEAIAKAGQ